MFLIKNLKVNKGEYSFGRIYIRCQKRAEKEEINGGRDQIVVLIKGAA